jgi:lipopolysaccharide/colanic/teichoic acid biosynthesis glycosyltransferase
MRSRSRINLQFDGFTAKPLSRFDGVSLQTLIMIQARGRRSFYALGMQNAGQFRLSQRLQDLVAASLMKRLGEFLIACILLVLTLPLMLIVALTVKWESPGPVVERRERIGTNGRPFQMLSFRTMAQRPGPVHSTWQPTAVGHFLRSTRINALPQLFNVLRGEMGLFETALFD